MQLKETILMINQNNQTILLQSDGSTNLVNQSSKAVLNQACLDYGSTLQGTVDAIKHHLKIKQKCPVCVSIRHHMMFFPIPYGEATCSLWIRYHPLMQAYAISSNQSVIQFNDSLKFTIDVNIRMIKRQIRRCYLYMNILDAVDYEHLSSHTSSGQIDLNDLLDGISGLYRLKDGVKSEKSFTH
jgi:competence protein ComK